MSVLGMVAWCAAALSLWLGARRHAASGQSLTESPAGEGAGRITPASGASRQSMARGYRWLAAAAALYCAGRLAQRVGGTVNPESGLSFADLPSLLALVAAAVGIGTLSSGQPPGAPGSPGAPDRPAQETEGGAVSVLPGLADGYVMAVALLVIGWITLFGGEFHRSGERPGTFLLTLIHPLADLAVLGALLPMITAAWRRAALPYLALLAAAAGDALAVGQRVSGGHLGVAAELMPVVAALLAGASPWRPPGAAARPGRAGGPAAATVVAVLAASAATLVVIGNGLAGAPASGVALVVAGGAGVLVLAARLVMLVRENDAVLRRWRESSRSLRDLASRTSDVVLVCDLDGVIGYASPAVEGYGYQAAALAGRRLLDFVHPEDRAAALAAVRHALGGRHPGAARGPGTGGRGTGGPGTGGPGSRGPGAGGPGGAGPGRFPARVRASDGTWRYIEATVLHYRVPGDAFAGAPGLGGGPHSQLLITARDVSDQVALRQQVTHLTFHDGLTGLPNRAYVEERARDVLRDPAASPKAGVIFLDLDRFTAVNDSVGHGAGDLVLAQAARRLRAVVPAQDTVARWGSDEFAVLVESAGSVQEVAEIAKRLAGAVAAEPFRVADQQIALTASVGVAFADADAGPRQNQGLVLRNADVAMSRAKEAGGDRVEVYAAHMHADVVRRLEIVSDLQRAIGGGELTVQYQPIVDLVTSRVTGAEALARWWRAGEAVTPREFLGAAEESGLIVPLGEWVLREACAQAAAWRRSSWDVGVSVNLSARQIAAPAFAGQVAAVLADTGLPPQALTVEVNERILVEEDDLIIAGLAELHRLGVRMALDNFGTGYASLAYLRRLPLDIIKIDPSFVAGLGTDDTLTLLTRTVVQVGRDLGLAVIAEGIEQPRQLAALREMGCGYGQGFLVAGPMAAPGVEALIRTAAGERAVSECETTPVSG
jgi:diguanylate cyclase (GGDEF)-like protein